jgi:hypothetical protein
MKNLCGTVGTGCVKRSGQSFDCLLEKVAQRSHFTTHSTMPPIATELALMFERRLFAVTPDRPKVGAPIS